MNREIAIDKTCNINNQRIILDADVDKFLIHVFPDSEPGT